jgi:hypothetical protein
VALIASCGQALESQGFNLSKLYSIIPLSSR